VAPERLVMSDDVSQVDVPGSEGDFGVLVNHAPMIAELRRLFEAEGRVIPVFDLPSRA
jgi:F-type H+-transporting ATPase subunit epsilon